MRLVSVLATAGLLSGLVSSTASGQIPLSSTPSRITFDDFRGTGVSPAPAAGQLDAESYLFLGFSDGPPSTAVPRFGVSRVTGDFARGTSLGGVVGGGLYAFDTDGAGDYAVGVQPTSADFVPGTFLVRFRNMTGAALTSVSFTADLKVYNDAPRASLVAFQVISDVVIDPATNAQTSDGTPTLVGEYLTPAEPSLIPAWTTTPVAGIATGIQIPGGKDFYVQVAVFDVASGSGARDEIALDNLVVSGNRGVASEGAPRPTVVGALFPNPATGPVQIAFATAATERVVVRLYDALGRLLATPYNALTALGTETVVALAGDLVAGAYVVHVSGETFAEARRFTVIR